MAIAGGNRGRKLKRTRPTLAPRCLGKLLRLHDARPIPAAAILIPQQNESTIIVEAGERPRAMHTDECQEAHRFWVIGHQPHERQMHDLGREAVRLGRT